MFFLSRNLKGWSRKSEQEKLTGREKNRFKALWNVFVFNPYRRWKRSRSKFSIKWSKNKKLRGRERKDWKREYLKRNTRKKLENIERYFRKTVKNVFGSHFEIKTKQSTKKNKTEKIVQKVNNRWRWLFCFDFRIKS